MTYQDIVYAISKGGEQPFVTNGDLAKRMGVTSKTITRWIKGMDIEAIDGKYYYAKEIATELAKRKRRVHV